MKRNKNIVIIQTVLMYVMHLPLYVFLILFNFVENMDKLEWFFYSGLIAELVVLPICLVSFIIGLLNFKNQADSPIKVTMICKLILIPWYVLNYITVAIFLGAMLNPFLMWGIPFVVSLAMFITYLFMIGMNSVSVFYVIKNCIVNKQKPNAMQLVGLIFQLFFCIDIIGSILLYVDEKRK